MALAAHGDTYDSPAFALSALSRRRLVGVHPDLIRCVERAIQITEVDFMVVEGVRDTARQRELVAKGASTTMNSRHLTGHAVDLCAVAGSRLLWGPPYAGQVAAAMKKAAKEFGVDLEWGGDWKSFVDTPHFQLSWASYPRQDDTWKTIAKPTPPKQEVKEALKKSRKYTVSGFFKWLLGFLGIGAPATWQGIKSTVDVGNDVMTTLQMLVSTYGFVAFSGVCIVAAIAFSWLQGRQKDDLEEGRYIPSGADK